jgi:flavin reductase (DIM6/NTAB) family NADH-FMN oxidoreductase RutF
MNHEAFYRISYGLYVVTSANGDQRNGYVANTVFQVTSKPARFAVACNKDNYTCDLIRQSQVFAVSILQQDTNAELIGLFGYQSGRTVDKFASVRHRPGQTGAPILLEDTLAWFECRVLQTIDVGTHLLFVGEVVDGNVVDNAQVPLTYAYYREVRKGRSPKNAPTYVEPAKDELSSGVSAPFEKHVCGICRYVYDPAVGDPDAGVPPGTRFEDLPENWVCPVCGATKADFVRQS